MRILTGVLMLLISFSAFADSHEEKTYVYGTYMYCDPALEDAADETFKKYYAPAYKASLKDGDITGWGYFKHHTGGKWRRLMYHTSSSVPAALKASSKQGEMIDKELKDKDNHLGKACRAHDDYIWQSKAGNRVDRVGKVALSVYMVCDMSNEGRADELVEEVFGPRYDEQLNKGGLSSWGWLSHVVGGKYRRLLTMTADNYDDLFAARAALLGASAGSSAGREFTSICGSHSDYLWDIEMEGR